MAKKTKKLTEDALVNEMQPQQAPVAQQATPEEMAQAQGQMPMTDNNVDPALPAEDVPADATESPLEQAAADQTITSDEMSPTNPADINTPPFPGAVAIGWTTPDKLGKAVAQATGDAEVASISPDVAPSVTGDELVDADNANPVQSDIVANANEANQLPEDTTQMNQLSPEEQEVIVEYRKYKASQMNKLVEEADPEEAEEDSNLDPITGMIFAKPGDNAIEATDAEEDIPEEEMKDLLDDVDSKDDADIVDDDTEIDDLPDDEEEVDVVTDTDVSNEIEIDDSLMGAIKDFLNDFDDDDSDIPEVLRDTADFLDNLLDADDAEENPVEDEVDEVSDDSEEVGDDDHPDDEVVVDEDEEVEVEEIPEDTNDDTDEEIDDTPDEDDVDDMTESTKTPASIAHTWRQQREAVGPMSSIKNAVNGREMNSPLNTNQTQPVNNVAPEYSTIKWPAGSGPNGSVSLQSNVGIVESNKKKKEGKLTDSYQKSSERRREAMRIYRNSLKEESRNSHTSKTNNRFKEALNTSSRINAQSDIKKDPKSWSSNRFIEKYEESSKLDFQKLLEDGFLG